MKNSCIVSCPIDTYSGYGARSRDFVKSLIKLKGEEWDIKILSQRWGETRFGYLEDHKETDLSSRIINSIPSKPDVWIQITVPNEFQPVGGYSIGVTAGIETTICDASWIEGCNRMNLVLTSSKHSKDVFEKTTYEIQDKRTKQITSKLVLNKPVEVLFEGVRLDTYRKLEPSENSLDLSSINESFCFLFVGHWLRGDFGHDRKNISRMIKIFLETFKNKPSKPALILKTQSANSSILDREDILNKIDKIRKEVKGSLPNIYLLHGEMDDQEINMLYNHSKVKAMVCLTKGEGFGRPLLEFSVIKKPIIASGWSGQMDFLSPELSILIGGKLEKVHASAVVKNTILEQSQWFEFDEAQARKAFKLAFSKYKGLIINGKRQGTNNINNFSFEKMTELLGEYLNQYVKVAPKQVELKMPTLKLPKLQKI